MGALVWKRQDSGKEPIRTCQQPPVSQQEQLCLKQAQQPQQQGLPRQPTANAPHNVHPSPKAQAAFAKAPQFLPGSTKGHTTLQMAATDGAPGRPSVGIPAFGGRPIKRMHSGGTPLPATAPSPRQATGSQLPPAKRQRLGTSTLPSAGPASNGSQPAAPPAARSHSRPTATGQPGAQAARPRPNGHPTPGPCASSPRPETLAAKQRALSELRQQIQEQEAQLARQKAAAAAAEAQKRAAEHAVKKQEAAAKAADVHRKHALQQGLKAIADSQPAAGAARTAAAAAQTSQAPSARAVSDADLERVLVCADDHACLGLKPGATAAEVRRAYRTLAMSYHPDKCKLGRAVEAFQRITRAYQGLLKHTGLL